MLEFVAHLEGSPELRWSGSGGSLARDARGFTLLAGFWSVGSGPHRASAEELHRRITGEGVRSLVTGGLSGQFSFVHGDLDGRRLWLVTDRFGTRSLYLRRTQSGFRAANHPALLHDPEETRVLETAALAQVVSHRRLLGRETMIRGVTRVLPGTWMELHADGAERSGRYWSLSFAPDESGRPFDEEVEELDRRLRAEMGRASGLTADRPVGVLLSGGVDSSVLAAIAREVFPEVITYTASIEGFDDPELERASAVAAALGVEHRVVQVGDPDIAQDFTDVIALIGEPPHHPNNLVLCKLLRTIGTECRLAAFGWAADTLFGSGQNAQVRNYLAKRRWISRIPPPVVRLLGRAIRDVGGARAFALGNLLLSDERRFVGRLDRIYYPRSVDRKLRARLDPRGWLPGSPEHWDERLDLETRAQRLAIYATTGSALLRAERLSAAAGVVPWSPFLGEPVVTFAGSLSPSLKVHDGRTKPLLRALCDRYLPEGVSGWPKVGFDTPWPRWLKGPLADATESARSDPLVLRTLEYAGCDVEDTRRSEELAWLALSLAEVGRTQGLVWPDEAATDTLAGGGSRH